MEIKHPAGTHTETRTVIVPAWDEVVIDTQAGWQRYSWTGWPHASDDRPLFPGSYWQANVKGDPHNIGVVGAYYRSNGNSGGAWFYLAAVPATSHIVHHDATTLEETVTFTDVAWTETIEYPAIVCPPDDDDVIVPEVVVEEDVIVPEVVVVVAPAAVVVAPAAVAIAAAPRFTG